MNPEEIANSLKEKLQREVVNNKSSSLSVVAFVLFYIFLLIVSPIVLAICLLATTMLIIYSYIAYPIRYWEQKKDKNNE